MKTSKIFAAALVFSAISSLAFAQTADEVIDRMVGLDIPLYSYADMQIQVYEGNKLTDEMNLQEFGMKKQEMKNAVFNIIKSNGYKGTRILQSEKTGVAASRWIYMPELRTTRRVAVSEGKKGWLGTDFTYDDMGIRATNEDNHEMLESNIVETVGGTNYSCYKIKSVPKKKTVEYSARIQYIDKGTYLPVKIEYLDKTGKLFKIYTIEKIANVKGATGKDYVLRQVNRIENINTKHTTICSVKKVVFDEKIKESYFTQNWLNTGKN